MLNEADVQSACLILAPRLGARLHRNNSGAFRDATGRHVRFGLGNISKVINSKFKSHDLIGWTAGGRFVSVECKPEGWSLTNHKLDDRERAQCAWLIAVAWCGGLAMFCSDPAQLEWALKRSW